MADEREEEGHLDICRVCRCEGSYDKPLYHPCVCTGSIKYIHQDCLVQWLKYSRKEYCELCKHRFSFTPIYSPDMPNRLPIKDIVSGLVTSMARAVRYWFHYTLVAFAWLGVVPLTACRIYRCLFTGSVSSLLTLPLDMLSTENLAGDCFQGCLVVTCTLCGFISLVWLREQILHGGGPDWLEQLGNNNNGNNPNRNGGLGPGGFNFIGGLAVGGGVNAAGANPNVAQEPVENAGGGNGAGGGGGPALEAEDVGIEDVDNGNNAAAQDDNNWNPIEWDRAAEELTWERLLGLDGSLVFLEHVFWVVSLNTLFILVFAFCPYHVGHFALVGAKMDIMVTASHFEGLLTTLAGYLVIAVFLLLIYSLCSLTGLRKGQRIFGLCYVVVKVKLLVVMEIGAFPLICGWWLDICSLSMFDASLSDRQASFLSSPGTSMFIHWLVGMVYVFYFASFILLTREVLRPGVLWFLRNLNDPEFNPIQEMIHLCVFRHFRRFIASVVIFGSAVLLMLWLPIKIIRMVFPGFLPYRVVVSSEAPVSELSLELLLLQVVLPSLLEAGHTRAMLKKLVEGWSKAVAWLLDLRSYLIGDVSLDGEDASNIVDNPEPDHPADPRDNQAGQQLPPAQQDLNEGLGAAHQAMLQGGGPTGFQPYKRPSFFIARISALIILMCITFFLASTISLVLPVFIGRQLMWLWVGDTKIHELYTAGCGLYICWLCLRVSTVVAGWYLQGWAIIKARLQLWSMLVVKSLVMAGVLLVMIPLLLGLLFDVIIVAPMRVPLDQSPIFFPWQDWALGVLHMKILTAVIMMGPQWWLKRAIERVYNDGMRNLNMKFIMTQICLPVSTCLGLALAVPYVIAYSIVPALGVNFETQTFVVRRIYPFVLTMIMCCGMLVFQVRQFRRLYNHIKDDKYLVGQRLVNYIHHATSHDRTPGTDTAAS
ncbi:E3 ubiquitin-protein ligase march6 [Plakobranchus ocellatus]|uniref:E3 ubiquitin-protein ligase MARCHF6 n=1 Tax=Plakobranchus ocellatus TaxID=259542 RepID=A0AAV4AJP7_9GAST|nr:E3 ubiquitin-protein ligase march6 [Plakobranchus ocellatus]